MTISTAQPPVTITKEDLEGEPAPKIDVMKLRILDARVLIQKYSGSDKTDVGLFLPKGATDERAVCVAKVLRVGDGRWDNGVRVPPRVKEGDNIIMGKLAGTQLTHENIRIINEIEIMAVLES
jgi:co-chaperonin GroES (HSP10)